MKQQFALFFRNGTGAHKELPYEELDRREEDSNQAPNDTNLSTLQPLGVMVA